MTEAGSRHLSLSDWVGREQISHDRIDPRPAIALAATLDLDDGFIEARGTLPPLWHWIYFTPAARRSELGVDGHPVRGGFLPPVELPNRMWAGGRFQFYRDLRLGEEVSRRSRIMRCERKSGRAGDLAFVTVHHWISGEQGLALEEDHDIVYRNPAAKGAALAGEVATQAADFRETIVPDPVLLFRYSALTFNGHRIHYDYPYVTETEGYPGLVFHGPLTATLLLEVFRKVHPAWRVREFSFRAVGPLFDHQPFEICGRITGPDEARLWTDCAGRLTMKADVRFAG